jgi:hypothetical protein
MLRPARLVLYVLVLSCAFPLGMAPPGFAQAPSLTGETLESDSAFAGQQTTTFGPFTCAKSGTTTIPFQTSGSAFGPYVGTFSESGTVVIGPQTNTTLDSRGVGAITSFQSTFTVQSQFPAGTVTGSKHLSPAAPTAATLAGGFGRCDPDGSSPPNSDTFVIVSDPNLLYTAQINTTILGSRNDDGTASVVLRSQPPPGSTNTFQESFNSTSAPPPPPPPVCDNDSGGPGNQGDDDCDDQGQNH